MSEWAPSDNNRKAKFYSLTPAGKKQLKLEVNHWARLTAAIALILETS